MANVNTPSGLSPVSYANGNTWNNQARMYCIFSTDTNAYAIGDPVASDATNGADANGVAAVTLATAGTGNALRGVIVGMGGTVFGGPGGDPANPFASTVIPATKTQKYYVMVCDDPDVLFEIQEVNSGTAIIMTGVGLNQNLLSGTNNGFVSGWTLNNSSIPAAGSTIQMKIMQLVQRRDNVPGLAQRWLVKINNHELAAGTTGV